MLKYFQLSDIKVDSLQCPRYGNCETGRALTADFCARYRCNTFYQLDTLRLPDKTKDETKETSQLSRVVANHFQQITPGNGNGHSGNGKGVAGKLRCIS